MFRFVGTDSCDSEVLRENMPVLLARIRRDYGYKEQRQIASMLLTRFGYSVETVSSGEEAIEYMRTNSADLLLLDMIMEPGIDGLDTYKNILELHPGIKAVIASGFSETDRVREVQRLGAGMYVKKPYTLEKIGLAVKAELTRDV